MYVEKYVDKRWEMKTLKTLLKVLLAGCCAVFILSILLMPYSTIPVHIKNPDKNTDYVWPSNAKWMKMTEGIAWGKYDEKGYNNAEVIENPDIIVLGSSHMEATNITNEENMTYILNEKIGDRYSVYNMGISGHHLYKVSKYLPVNLELFESTPKAVIIETDSVNIDQKNVDKLLEGNVDFTPSYDTGIIRKLQMVPFLRIVHQNIDSGLLKLFMPEISAKTTSSVKPQEKSSIDEKPYETLLKYIGDIGKEYSTHIIICYHPTGVLNKDGTLSYNCEEYSDVFKKYAEENGITYVNLQSEFEKMYIEKNLVSHGFTTGKVEYGHLNRYGHKKMAEALYETINKLEKEKVICK